MRPYFIINPVACAGAVNGKFAEAKAVLDEHGEEYEYVYTEHAHESTALAERAYANGERMIVAVGGDGTVNEVVSALYDKADVTMGILPFGTGNDFARALNLPYSPREAAELIVSGKSRMIDVGMANDRPFINVGGMGFDVDVVINTEKFKRRFRGMIPYMLGVVQSLLHLKRIKAVITSDGKEENVDMLLCAVANGTHFGGGMAVAPKADVTDGEFDVCMIRSAGLLKLLLLLPAFVKGRHLGNKLVRYYRAKEVKIECEPSPLQLDGELGAFAPVRFRLLHDALRVIAP